MPKIESKELLLSSVISKEIESLSGKMDFWQVDHPAVETLWQSEKPLSLEETLAMIDPESDDLKQSENFRLLYGIAWEFVWGQKPPEIVKALRDEVITKVRYGLQTNDLEKLWYNLILVDTDMF